MRVLDLPMIRFRARSRVARGRSLSILYGMGSFLLLCRMPLVAQDALEELICSGGDISCVNDTFEIVVDGQGAVAHPEHPIFGIEVMGEMDSIGVEGWSFGITHATSELRLLPESATVAGADIARFRVAPSFQRTMAVETTGARSGFVSVVLFPGTGSLADLRRFRLSIARARYEIVAELPEEGARIEFADGALESDGMPVPLGWTIGGEIRRPRRVVHGVVHDDAAEPRLVSIEDERLCEIESDALCVPDAMRLRFHSKHGPRSARASVGESIVAHVCADLVTPDVAGWSLGVAHDTRFLRLDSLGVDGTDVPSFARDPFFAVTARASSDDGREGFVSVGLLGLETPAVLPLGVRVSFTRASYAVVEELPEEGAEIRIVDGVLRGADGVGVPVEWTVAGESRRPARLGHGRVDRAVSRADGFIRGDADLDGRLTISDAIRVFEHLFGGVVDSRCRDAFDSNDSGLIEVSDPLHLLLYLFRGSRAPLPPRECGADPTPDGQPECFAICR